MSAAARGAAGWLARQRNVPPAKSDQQSENERDLAMRAAEQLRLEREAKKAA